MGEHRSGRWKRAQARWKPWLRAAGKGCVYILSVYE
jgi:hypothetical protein